MIIFYDVSRILSRRFSKHATGIDRVDINYAFYLKNHNNTQFIYQKRNHFYLLIDKGLINHLYNVWINNNIFAKTEIKTLYLLDNERKTRKFVSNKLSSYLEKNRSFKKIYINTSHNYSNTLESFFYFKQKNELIYLSFIHDLIPVEYPEYTRFTSINRYNSLFKIALKTSDIVFTNSNATLQAIKKFCCVNDIPIPQSYVNYIGIEETFITKAKESNDKYFLDNTNYFVYTSTIEPRKNHILLLNIWRDWSRRSSDIPKLVLIGKRGWGNYDLFNFLDQSPHIRKYVIELNNLNDNEMIQITKHSLGLLYPSFVEGWGMPIVEAIALNKPVICSDIAAHRESGQNLVNYLSPLDGIGWQKEIEKLYKKVYVDQPVLYKSYIFPTWKAHFIFMNKTLNKAKYVKYDSLNAEISQFQSVQESHSQRLNHLLEKLFPKRKMIKLINNPIEFFEDSKIILLRKFGSYLRNISSK